MNTEELLTRVNSIRKSYGHVSNVFLTRPQLDALLAQGKTRVLTSESVVLVLEDKSTFLRLNFWARNDSLECFAPLLNVLPKPVVADIVGKDPDARDLALKLQSSHFEHYSTFVRLSTTEPRRPANVDVSLVEYAEPEDGDRINSLLYSEFDPFFAHLPTGDDIVKAIHKREITVIRKSDKVVGFAFFEPLSAASTCLRYFVVDEAFRGQGFGNHLLTHAFNKYPAGTKYVLWVGTYNKALQMYRHFSFNEDGLIDYIMTFRGDSGDE